MKFPFHEGDNLEEEKQFLIGLLFLSKPNFTVWISPVVQKPSKEVEGNEELNKNKRPGSIQCF